jgi:hypothetical protein
MTTHSQLIGKYVFIDNLHYDPRDGYYGGIGLCKSLEGTLFIFITKFGQIHTTTIDHITKIIDVTEKQKFQIGDEVKAIVDYIGPYHESIDDYCKVTDVKTFCNDIEYELVVIKTGKKINTPQHNIRTKVTMPTPKYSSGMRIGVKVMQGCQYDYWEEVHNAIITNVEVWYTGVKYTVTFDSGKISTVEESMITAPAIIKTPEQKKLDEKTFLIQREQQLLAELEMTRKALNRN